MKTPNTHDDFMKVHAELIDVRKKIIEHEHALSILRQTERGLEAQSTYYFRCMAEARS